jgi:hypothetical protein
MSGRVSMVPQTISKEVDAPLEGYQFLYRAMVFVLPQNLALPDIVLPIPLL